MTIPYVAGVVYSREDEYRNPHYSLSKDNNSSCCSGGVLPGGCEPQSALSFKQRLHVAGEVYSHEYAYHNPHCSLSKDDNFSCCRGGVHTLRMRTTIRTAFLSQKRQFLMLQGWCTDVRIRTAIRIVL
jgi:hypothetical protein